MEKWSRLLLLLRCVEYELRSEFFIRLTTENCKSFRFRIHSNCCVMVLLVNAKVEHTHTVCGTCFDCMGFRIWNVRLPFAMCADHVATCIKSSAKWNSLFFLRIWIWIFRCYECRYVYVHVLPSNAKGNTFFVFTREKSLYCDRPWQTVTIARNRQKSREICEKCRSSFENLAFMPF